MGQRLRSPGLQDKGFFIDNGNGMCYNETVLEAITAVAQIRVIQ